MLTYLYCPIFLFVMVNASFKELLLQLKYVKGNLPELRDHQKKELTEAFPHTNIIATYNKLRNIRSEYAKQLKLSDKGKEELGNVEENIIGSDSIEDINKASNIAAVLYQGDIVLTSEQATDIEYQNVVPRLKRQAFRNRRYPNTIWGKVVYYFFDKSASPAVRQVFQKAAQFWENNTCIDFKQNSMVKNKIRVFMDSGCYSYIGRIGGTQELSLGRGCETECLRTNLIVDIAAHELGHALGFFHTHSRSDRDEFITLNVDNIEPSFVDQFHKESAATNFNYGITYDYGSVMHYGSRSAARDNEATITAKDINYQETMGSSMVSFYDISMMNEHYKCKSRCPAVSSARCRNGGFPHPRSCSRCICPNGYGGKLCDQRPTGCGSTVNATVTFQQLNRTLTNPKGNFIFCHYWIKAPAGKTIEVRISSLLNTRPVDGCKFGGVEIKTNADQKLTGYRFCSPSAVGTTLKSSNNLVPIIIFNRLFKTSMTLQYRYVDQQNSNACQDTNSRCSDLVSRGFCSFFSMDIKSRLCPHSCGLC